MILACAFTPWRADLPAFVQLRAYFLPAAIAVALLAALRTSRRAQLLIVLATAPVALVVIPLELFLGSTSHRLDRAYERAAQVPVLRVAGLNVFPILAPWDLTYGHRVLRTSDGPALPLTGMSNQPTALCQLGGLELVFQSDSFGFRNRVRPVAESVTNVALVGDSFAHGYCVEDSASMAGRISSAFGSVENLGVTGAGPLWELGVIREYASRLRPRVIVWAFYEGNDLEGIDVEKTGFAANYLDRAFSQRLADRKRTIEAAVQSRLDSIAASFDQGPAERFRQLILFRATRARLALSVRPRETAVAPSGSPIESDIPLLEKIVKVAKDEAAGWGGQILFVYLPDRDRYTAALRNTPEFSMPGHHSAHARVVSKIASLGVDVLDIVPVLAGQPAPLALFDEGGVHYNGRGYKLVADSIVAHLSRGPLRGVKLPAADDHLMEASVVRVPDRWMKFTPLSAASIARSELAR